ncbi:MAG: response regulator [Cytophagales bacterium]
MTNTNQLNTDQTAAKIGKTLDLVMLIDDHDISNFMAQQVVINTKIAKRSIVQPAGFSAINYLLKHQENPNEIPNLIFLDLDMPVMNGFEFLLKFTELPASITSKCKIVILSGFDKKEELEPWFKNKTIIFYMLKPLKPSNLEVFKQSEAYNMLFN